MPRHDGGGAAVDRIVVAGLRAMGVHGVEPVERSRPQPFAVDLVLDVDLSLAGATDKLADTVDYGAVAEAAVAVVTGESHHLLERIATRIAQVCRADPRVIRATVTVSKLAPPLGVQVDHVAVTIAR